LWPEIKKRKKKINGHMGGEGHPYQFNCRLTNEGMTGGYKQERSVHTKRSTSRLWKANETRDRPASKDTKKDEGKKECLEEA